MELHRPAYGLRAPDLFLRLPSGTANLLAANIGTLLNLTHWRWPAETFQIAQLDLGEISDSVGETHVLEFFVGTGLTKLCSAIKSPQTKPLEKPHTYCGPSQPYAASSRLKITVDGKVHISGH